MASRPKSIPLVAAPPSAGGLTILRRLWELLRLIRAGHGARVLRAVAFRLRSDTRALGLRRDLSLPLTAPPAKIDLVVRPLKPEDDLSFLDPEAPGIGSGSAYDRMAQRRLVADDLATCYVAVAPDGRICYLQWLLGSRDNDRIQARWSGLFPRLADDEALLEGAYTVESFRGQGIMANAMARIAERALDLGARRVVTFVGDDNIASLKGCKKAGFFPYVERRESWLLFRRRIRFRPLPEGTPYSFDTAESRSESSRAALRADSGAGSTSGSR